MRLKGIKFRADRALKDEVGNVKLKNFRHSGHSGKLSDVEIDMRLKAYFAEHQLMTRADFQRICGFMRSKAAEHLKRLNAEGKIENIGRKTQPICAGGRILWSQPGAARNEISQQKEHPSTRYAR